MRQNIDTFIQENNIMMLNKDPTQSYHRQLQQTMKKCEDLIEKNPKLYINELIIDTENAIRHLQSNIQSTLRYLVAKKIKQMKESNRHNTMHRRY